MKRRGYSVTQSYASVGQSMIPDTAGAYDLGSATIEWRAIYLHEGATSGIYFGEGQDFRQYTDGTDLFIVGSGALHIQTSGDVDDYLSITTVSNVVNFTATGSSTFKFNQAVDLAAGAQAAASKSIDAYTNSGYLKCRHVSQSAQPAAQVGELIIWHDTDDAKTYLIINEPTVGARGVELT